MNEHWIRLNDHNFIAWINVKKSKKIKVELGKLYVDMSHDEYTSFKEEYQETIKPTLTAIRKLVRKIAESVPSTGLQTQSVLYPPHQSQ